jgi:hypothetical protein
MKDFLSLAAAASTVACLAATATPADAQPAALAPNPQIETAYVPPGPENPALMPIYQQMQSHKVLEALQLFLAPLQLPAKLTVKFDQCHGAPRAPYVHGGPVTICYEYVAQIEQMVPKSAVVLVQGNITPDAAIVGPVVQAMLHETAIGVFDILNIPVWGDLDDAADRLSAFIMLQFGPNVAWNTIVGTAWFLSGNIANAADFSAVGRVVAQRYYTTICIAFGGQMRRAIPSGDGVDFTKFVSQYSGEDAAGNLPDSRAKSCPYEYDAVKAAFVSLFMQTKLVDPALLAQVQQKLACKQNQAGDPLFQFACEAVR